MIDSCRATYMAAIRRACQTLTPVINNAIDSVRQIDIRKAAKITAGAIGAGIATYAAYMTAPTIYRTMDECLHPPRVCVHDFVGHSCHTLETLCTQTSATIKNNAMPLLLTVLCAGMAAQHFQNRRIQRQLENLQNQAIAAPPKAAPPHPLPALPLAPLDIPAPPPVSAAPLAPPPEAPPLVNVPAPPPVPPPGSPGRVPAAPAASFLATLAGGMSHLRPAGARAQSAAVPRQVPVPGLSFADLAVQKQAERAAKQGSQKIVSPRELIQQRKEAEKRKNREKLQANPKPPATFSVSAALVAGAAGRRAAVDDDSDNDSTGSESGDEKGPAVRVPTPPPSSHSTDESKSPRRPSPAPSSSSHESAPQAPAMGHRLSTLRQMQNTAPAAAPAARGTFQIPPLKRVKNSVVDTGYRQTSLPPADPKPAVE